MTRTILPHELPTLLDQHPEVRLLSLDCFDTLLWRDVNAPADLFAILGDVTTIQRRRGEQSARKARQLAREVSAEVTLAEIYDALLPHADRAARDAAMAREIAVETAHCHAFAPTVALMRAARERGLPVVIVSDTYFTRDQLHELIRASAGEEVIALIDEIYCSCDHRSAKGEELFPIMLAARGVAAVDVLHVGDNPNADLVGAERHGVVARHLVQFTAQAVQRLRLEATAGALLAGDGIAWQPHRAALAVGEPEIEDAGEAIGYAALGPVLTGFAHWIAAEAATLAAQNGGRVHPLFLMRDGHLPCEVFRAVHPQAAAHPVEISRFTATAAALLDAEAVRRFIHDEIGDGAGTSFLRQLLLTDGEATKLIAALPKNDAARALADRLLSPAWIPVIVSRGKALLDRLVAHVRATCDIAPGDTLMLVDLGYNGTVQNKISAPLADALGVHVAGRYLILSEDEPSGLDKRGWFDRSGFDTRALEALTGSVAVLEQFCTVPQGSTIDYRADGTPLRADSGIKSQQSAVRDRVQRGAVIFAQRAGRDVLRSVPASASAQRRAALATLGRLLFLPMPHELALIAQFEHDANLGTDDRMALFDPAIAAQGLRERGLFYLRDSERMFLPAELRGHGLPTSLTLLAQRRFALDLRYPDFCDRSLTLPVMVADGTGAFVDTVEASPTHDGWFIAAIPVGACRYTVGVQFGRLFDYVQIDSASFLPVAAYLAGAERTGALAVPAHPSAEGMEQVASHLFRCNEADAFLMVPPPAETKAGQAMMLTVVFRPIAAREGALPVDSARAEARVSG